MELHGLFIKSRTIPDSVRLYAVANTHRIIHHWWV
jgi:hypothetical protein